MSEIIYSYETGLVLIEKKVVTTLNTFRQTGERSEAGGILIGFRRPPHIHVVACTTPFSNDKCTRVEYLRCDSRHAEVAQKYWDDSNGEVYYLGEWHTHPTEVPNPSSIDVKEWKKLMKSSLGPDLLFVIVGKSEWCVHLANSKLLLFE